MKKILGILLLIVILGITTYNVMNSRTFQIFGDIIPRVSTEEKVVALTFDDGPTVETDEILKVLNESCTKATFFLVGSSMENNLEEAKSIVEAGHELGNHTYSHSMMIFKSPSFIKQEIEKTDNLIRQAGYQGDILYRPPYCKKLIFSTYYLAENNRKTITWNIEPDSYSEVASDAEKIIDNVLENIQPGSIILLHVMYDDEERESLESIKGLITSLKEQGYTFKTVSELLEYDSN